MKSKNITVPALLLLLSTLCVAPVQAQSPAAALSEHEAGLQAYRDAKFGLFLHWGLYAVPAGTWNGNTGLGEWFQIQTKMPLAEYVKFADQFNPVKFDANEWVKHAKDAGFKYIVITTKHHDGFAMYDTKQDDYNIVKATPWHHDPMKDLAAACQQQGVQLCFYYSIPDWHSSEFPARYSQRRFHGNPNADADLEKYIAFMKAQLREILTQYGPISCLWFDDGGAFEGIDKVQRAKMIHAQEIVDMIRELQPRCVVNDRLGVPGDYGSPEQRIPGSKPGGFFEVCMSLNGHWSYNQNDHRWKEPKVVVRNLVDVASKGGNYLLGIGPTAEGILPPEAVAVFDQVGQWLKVNSDSIYGSEASPFTRLSFDGRCTRKQGTLYLHVYTWPKDGQLAVAITNPVKHAYLLADPAHAALKVTVSENGATVAVPEAMSDPIDTVIALEIEGELKPAATQ